MKWIKAHKAITALICVIIALAVIILASFASGGSSNVVGRTIQSVVTAVEKPISSVTEGIKEGFRGVFRFKSVVNENEKLKDELASLKQKNSKLSLKREEYQELKKLEKSLNYDAAKNRKLVSADIVSVDSSNWMNVCTVNKGTESGIKKDKIVVNGSGLVGRIIDAGKGWAKVSSIINDSSKVSFRIFRDRKLTGIVQGDGNNGLSGYMLDGKAGVIDGDLLITSGIGLFPDGLEIGKVQKVNYNKDSQHKEITVKTSVNFRSLKKVAIII